MIRILSTVTYNGGLSWIIKIGIILISYFAPIYDIIGLMFILVIGDLITGIWASYKKHKKEKGWFTSNKLSRTVTKVVIYPLAIVLTFHFSEVLSLQSWHMTHIVAGFICFVELISFFENCYYITDEPIFIRIVEMLKDNFIKRITGKKDENKNNITE